MKTVRQWYRVQNQASDPTVAEIHIIDFIGDWVDDLINQFWGVTATLTAKAFIDQLTALADDVKTIRVHINSPGGDVFAAVNIANALRDQVATKGRTVETIVDGLAASAASIILMAGQTVKMADNALVMIHNPLTGLWGNATDLRKAADTLDTIGQTIIATYQWHSTLDAAALKALMDAETWMSADEAVANGFVTAKVSGIAAAASIDPTVMAALTIPEPYRARVQAFLKPAPAAPVAASALEVVRACNAGGCPELTEELLTAKATLATVTARITETTAARTAAAARETDIRALCVAAKQPELADGYVKGQMSVADIKAHLVIVTAKQDRVEIDAGLKPGGGHAGAAVIDTTAIYAARNRPLAQKEQR